LGKKDGSQPTYIYPEELKAVVRARFPKATKKYANPEGPKVRST